MKVIITALSMAFLIGSAVAEFEWFFKMYNYDNPSAFYLAQENSSRTTLQASLFPTKEIYEKIDAELKSLTLKNPELADIHQKTSQAPGKAYLTNIDLDALYKSFYGPFEAFYDGQSNGVDTYLVSFDRPFYIDPTFMMEMDRYKRGNTLIQYFATPVTVEPRDTWIERKAVGEEIHYEFKKIDKCFDVYKCDHSKDRQWVVVA